MYFRGLYLYFTGDDKNIYIGYNNQFQKINTATPKAEAIDATRQLFFYIRGSESQIKVAMHYEKEDKYNTLATFEINPSDMELFFVNFFARSTHSGAFMVDVRSMVLSTNVENIGVSEFEAKFDENAQKLFRQISFYKLSEELLDEKRKKQLKDDFNIKSLYESQTEVLNILDYTNVLLDKNLDEGDEMLEFLSKQKNSTQEYAKSLFDSMNEWISDTQKQFDLMQKDALNLMTEYEKFDLEQEFGRTKEIITKVNQKVGSNWEAFQNFRLYADQVRSNLSYLTKKKKHLENFSEMMEHYIQGRMAAPDNEHNNSFLFMMVTLGAIVVLALLAILKRLGSSQKVRTFE